jgi:hypothetical protein
MTGGTAAGECDYFAVFTHDASTDYPMRPLEKTPVGAAIICEKAFRRLRQDRRIHRTDPEEFYQLLSYTDDVDLNLKLQAWENFYNYHRPDLSHHGKTPNEMMRLLLKNEVKVSGRS